MGKEFITCQVIVIALLVVGIINVEKVCGGVGFGPCNQWYDYITVNGFYKIFVWLVQCNNGNIYDYSTVIHNKPLLIHVGGPEISASGFGFFYETGPMNKKNLTKPDSVTEIVNVLFIDLPVGVGFSYTNQGINSYPKKSSHIAIDLVDTIIQLFDKLPFLRSMPVIIYSESYATKYTVEGTYKLHQINKERHLGINLLAVVLGSPWINPAQMVLHWAEYAFVNSLLNAEGRDEVYSYIHQQIIPKITSNDQDIYEAGQKFKYLRSRLKEMTNGINECNIMVSACRDHGVLSNKDQSEVLSSLINCGIWSKKLQPYMNKAVKQRLGHVVPNHIQWNIDEKTVIKHLAGDLMSPSAETYVGLLLNTTQLLVAFINGQVDMVTNNIGVQNWLDSIKWPGQSQFKKAEPKAFSSNIHSCKGLAGYYKRFMQLYHFKLLYTGHYVAKENHRGLRRILEILFARSRE